MTRIDFSNHTYPHQYLCSRQLRVHMTTPREPRIHRARWLMGRGDGNFGCPGNFASRFQTWVFNGGNRGEYIEQGKWWKEQPEVEHLERRWWMQRMDQETSTALMRRVYFIIIHIIIIPGNITPSYKSSCQLIVTILMKFPTPPKSYATIFL